jgi:hypothetical protein
MSSSPGIIKIGSCKNDTPWGSRINWRKLSFDSLCHHVVGRIHRLSNIQSILLYKGAQENQTHSSSRAPKICYQWWIMDWEAGSRWNVMRLPIRLTKVSFCKKWKMGKQVHRNQPLGNYVQPNTKTMYGASSSGRVADPKDPPTI